VNTQSIDPRQVAWKIIQSALTAVDPALAVKNYFDSYPLVAAKIEATPGQLIVVGAGKASMPMATAVSEIFGDKILDGQIIVKYGHTDQSEAETFAVIPRKIRIKEAGHPVPDRAGLVAAQEIADLVDQTSQDDTVLCLISGGASALLTLPATGGAPADGLNLGDLQATTEALLAAGSTINEINTIRKHLSAIKGGQLARRAAPARVHTLILSDVVGDALEVIGSGPTVPDPTTFANAWAIVEQYQLENTLPKPVVRRLQAGVAGVLPDTPKPGDSLFERVTNAIIGSNCMAAQAAVEAAQLAGFEAHLLTTFIEGEAREVGRVMAGLAKGLLRNEGSFIRPVCLVAGGETTVTIKGSGKGGRNQEMALAASIALDGWLDTLIVCLGTDGTDGPTDAAGAFADGTIVRRAKALGLDAVKYLNNNDAYNFFMALDELILTGPTNTNVNDLILILAW
jgi:hydroxypyruvate reductase